MRLSGISVSLITFQTLGGKLHGFGCTTACAISIDPPSMLFTIRSASADLDLVRDSGKVCVNAIGAGDLDKVEMFTRPDLVAERFSSPDWRHGWEGMPYLASAISNIYCEIEQEHAYGSEQVFFARIMDVRVNEQKSSEQPDPLLWLNGRPGRLVYG